MCLYLKVPLRAGAMGAHICVRLRTTIGVNDLLIQVDSKMIVEEDTDLIVHDPQNNCTTKYEIVFVDTRSRKSVDDIHQHVVSEQVVVAS